MTPRSSAGKISPRRQQLHVDAELRVDAARKTGNAHLQALEVVDLLDRLLEPAGHLHAGVAHRDGHQIEGRVHLLPQLHAAAVVEPGVHALEIEAERHGGEILRGEGLAGPEVGVGAVHLDGALRHRVEAFQRGDQLAGGEVLNLEPALRHGIDHLDEVGRAAGALHVEGSARADRHWSSST